MSTHVTNTSEAEDITLKEIENRLQKPCSASINSSARQEDHNTSDKTFQAHPFAVSNLPNRSSPSQKIPDILITSAPPLNNESSSDETLKDLAKEKTLEYLSVQKFSRKHDSIESDNKIYNSLYNW